MSFTNFTNFVKFFNFILLLCIVGLEESFNSYKGYKEDSTFFDLFNSQELQNKIVMYNQVRRI